MRQRSFWLRWKILIPSLLATGLLVWGGRHAYCHLRGGMAAGPATRTSRPRPAALVRVVQPVPGPAVQTLTLPASVEPYEKAALYAKVSGYLQWIKVDMGDAVRAGEIMARIAVPEMEKEYERAESAIQEAEAAGERARADASLKELTFRRLAGIRTSQPDVIAEQDVDVARAQYEVARSEVKLAESKLASARTEAARLQTLLGYAEIHAPFDGLVTTRNVDPGAFIQSATASKTENAAILTVMQIDIVRVNFHVPELGVPVARVGDPVEVKLGALPRNIFSGRVARFAGALDLQTRTMRTEVDLPNPRHDIRPGMFGTATLKLVKQNVAWFVPSESIHEDAGGRRYVYLVDGGRLRKVAVEVGWHDGNLVQVEGLKTGDQVVLRSDQELQDGLPVTTPPS